MGNQFVGRREAVGLGKETTAGTPVAPAVWIPKKKGILQPIYENAIDDSGWGNIDEVYDSQTVKSITKASLGGIIRDDYIGYLLLGALGTRTSVAMGKPTSITGTPVRGVACYQGSTVGTATWVGVLKKILIVGANTYYFVSTTSGTLTNATTIKEAIASPTRTLVAFDITTYTSVKAHLFERANTNSHQSFTLYGDDPTGQVYSPYAMIGNLKLSASVGEYAEFESEIMGKKLVSTSGNTPSYTDSTPFLAKHASVKFATAESGLNAATDTEVQSFSLNIEKNLIDVQTFGSTDVDGIYNQQFTLNGDMEALFEDTTLRDYVVNSTKKACRFSLINSEVTALVSGIYPSIYIDLAKIGLSDWAKSDDLNGIVKQTMGYTGEYKASDLMSMEVLLLNSTTTY